MDCEETIRRIHDSPHRCVLAVAGGGARAVAALLSTPGASRTVLEAIVPYDTSALRRLLGGPVDSACSDRAARAMAMAAFRRAVTYRPEEVETQIGVGCTAALATDRPLRGGRRFYIAMQTARSTESSCWRIDGPPPDRSADEDAVARQLIASLADACGVEHGLRLPPADEHRRETADPTWVEVALGRRRYCLVGANGEGEPPRVLLPGSFNPWHEGHQRITEVVEEITGQSPVCELSVVNVDKPPLDYVEIASRVAHIPSRPMVLSAAPTFVEKSEIAPGATFVVGADTVVRLGDPRYYGDSVAARDAALEKLAENGCRFLVFGRQIEGRFHSIASLSLPPTLAGLCEGPSEDQFRVDQSSTELRDSRDPHATGDQPRD